MDYVIMIINIKDIILFFSILIPLATFIGMLIYYKSQINKNTLKLDLLCKKVDSDIRDRITAILQWQKIAMKQNEYLTKLYLKMTLAILNLIKKMLQYTLKFYSFSLSIAVISLKIQNILLLKGTK